MECVGICWLLHWPCSLSTNKVTSISLPLGSLWFAHFYFFIDSCLITWLHAKYPPPYRFVFWDSAKLKQVLQVFVKYYHCANMIVTKLVRIYIFEMIECSERCFLLWARQTLINEDIASAIEQVFNYLNYSRVGWPFILPFLHLAGGNKGRKQGKGEEKNVFGSCWGGVGGSFGVKWEFMFL